MFIKFLYLNLIIWPLLFSGQSNIKMIWVKCIKVVDGDTIIAVYNLKKLKLRLAYIDAPEISQKSLDNIYIGKLSKDYLEKLVLNESLKIRLIEKDFFGRWIAEIYQDDRLINLVLVQQGMAIIYEKAKFQNKNIKNQFLKNYFLAKMRGVGIWKTKGMLNPKFYRKIKALKTQGR